MKNIDLSRDNLEPSTEELKLRQESEEIRIARLRREQKITTPEQEEIEREVFRRFWEVGRPLEIQIRRRLNTEIKLGAFSLGKANSGISDGTR